MAELIQRVPAGVSQLLSISGGVQPKALDDRVIGVLDLLQHYALNQLQTGLTNNAALAEAGTVDILLPAGTWCVLFAAAVTVVKTATMTAARANISLRRGAGNFQQYAADELGPFGATETGPASHSFVAPYPILMPPGSVIRGGLNILGTDAAANVTITAEFGVLG